MDEFISANPCNFDHGSLFELVQRLTLDHRLNDSYSCLVRTVFLELFLWFLPEGAACLSMWWAGPVVGLTSAATDAFVFRVGSVRVRCLS